MKLLSCTFVIIESKKIVNSKTGFTKIEMKITAWISFMLNFLVGPCINEMKHLNKIHL